MTFGGLTFLAPLTLLGLLVLPIIWWILRVTPPSPKKETIALARPILQQADGITTRPLTLVIDDGWDAAPNWSNVIREAEAKVADARRKNVDVLLVTTAEPSTGAKFVPAEDAMRTIKSLPPQRYKAAKALSGADLSGSEAIWLSSGVDFGRAEDLNIALKTAAKASRLERNA